MSDFQTPEDRDPTFEETYPRYEFSQLVRISLAIADWLARRRRARRQHRPPRPRRPSRLATRAGGLVSCRFHPFG